MALNGALNLTARDRQKFSRFGVGPELLERFGVRRVDDREARELLSINGRPGDMAGLEYPYYRPYDNDDDRPHRRASRVRRDCPEIEAGKEKNKYLSSYGDRHYLYWTPGSRELLADPTVLVILVEAEKSVLALTAWAERTSRTILPVGLGGCWGWKGTTGKAEGPRGERLDEKGPIPDLDYLNGHEVVICFDANARSNGEVRIARARLAKELRSRKCRVRIADLPDIEGVNGPDDYIGAQGDEAMARILDAAESPRRKPASSTCIHDGVALVCTQEGTPKGVLANAIAMLRYSPEWLGVLGFNQFSLYAVTRKPAPWPQSKAGDNWTDSDDCRAAEWLQQHSVIVSSRVTAEAVQVIAEENRFHPVREYLSSLKWDGKPRLATWLLDYLGAPDIPFTRAVGTRWLVSAVARIFQPGCQVDHVLLLEGPQGIRKSTGLRVLAGDEWFADHISDLGSKDSRMDLHGKWILEMAELDKVRRGELEKVKAFLTARTDHFRVPYGRRTEDVPRSCVFAGSLNDQTPLTDETGNRRFWPVRCGTIDIDALSRDRDQLWAEACQEFQAGAVWWLDSEELVAAAAVEQEQRYENGVWDDAILAWCDDPKQRSERDRENLIPIEPFDSTRDQVTVTDILVHGIGKPLDRCTQADRNQIARCLVHDGWGRRLLRQGERRLWAYLRPWKADK
jgi:predicted P-loop ATPase